MALQTLVEYKASGPFNKVQYVHIGSRLQYTESHWEGNHLEQAGPMLHEFIRCSGDVWSGSGWFLDVVFPKPG